jgi:hypothetical protein
MCFLFEDTEILIYDSETPKSSAGFNPYPDITPARQMGPRFENGVFIPAPANVSAGANGIAANYHPAGTPAAPSGVDAALKSGAVSDAPKDYGY